MFRTFIGIGSNSGDRLAAIQSAITMLSKTARPDRVVISSIYETEPFGYRNQAYFLNGVIEIATPLNPLETLRCLQRIERELGRKRGIKWGPRTIDLDILAIEGFECEKKELTVPHPGLAERRFVLVPFDEIAPCFVIARLNKTVRQLLNQTTDESQVNLYITSGALMKKLKEVTQ
ncbi:2-amino-4-hydroxy-6-hydroxymethyldihydropteridine diphosphokinase [candidate division KSB1 bacterium RBG_16_48_16]|nr:MAG: 2-amino-4-hydroxy-6-hydroxymethyldihydropteridine diphosphokinase [candidate division KSB1 bacterium RBG_16_48_16]